jgi:cytochrome bd-type quinol oxidase subunit 2
MGNDIPEDPYRTIARERSHEEAKQTVATNRMLVQSLILINGGAAIVALAFYGAHDLHAPGKTVLPLVIILYCLGICIAVFAGLYLRRANQEWSIFWDSSLTLRCRSGKKR